MDDADDAVLRALGRGWLDDDPWRLLTRLTELDDRLGGHPGERRAAGLVADAFDRAGVRAVRERSFEMTRWRCHGADLAVRVPERDVERSFEAVALPYSPAVETEAPLVDVGHATPSELDAADVAGSVVVANTATPPDFERPYHRNEKAARAAAAGVAGFVFVNHVPGQLPPTGALGFGAEAAVPGLGVSSETGAWLREYADEGGRARPRVDAGTEPATSRNVLGRVGPDPADAGRVPGPAGTGDDAGADADDAVLVVAHLDAHDVGEGALDNGCGVATLCGMAAILARLELARPVRVAAVGSEELGLLGSRALADRLDPSSLHAVVNVDGAGRYRDLNALVHTSDALADLVERVAGRAGHPVGVQDRPHPYSDHWPFLRAGVPALQLHSEAPDSDGPWDRGWTHTRADTRDKADRRNLRTHAMLGALLVREVAAAELPRVDTGDLRARLEEVGTAEGMRVGGVWPDGWA